MADYESERRRQRALERLWSSDPRCVICGETNPHCLERHHIAGRTYGDECVTICRNCHRKLSDPQKYHPSQVATPPDLTESAGHFLLGLADFFVELVEPLRKYGRELIERARSAGGGPSEPPL